MNTTELLTTAQVSSDLKIDRSTLSRWIKDGTAKPALRLPGKSGTYLFSVDELLRLRPIAAERKMGSVSA